MNRHPFAYPVVAFIPDFENEFEVYGNDDELTSGSQNELDLEQLALQTVVDSSGRAWKVETVRIVPREGPTWRRWLWTLRGWQSELQYDVVELPPVTYACVAERVCGSIQENADFWCYPELVGGEGRNGSWSHQSLLEAFKARVRATSSIAELDALLKEDFRWAWAEQKARMALAKATAAGDA